MNNNEFKLYDHQELILDEIVEKFNYRDQLVSTLGMGGGKSVIISATARHYYNQGKNVAILTNISELIPQLAEHLEGLNLPFQIIKSGFEDVCETPSDKGKIFLIMEQSFHENYRNDNLHITCDILIKDEYHIGIGKSRYESIKEFLSPSKVLGLSGTPLDNMGFLMQGVELEDLIMHGSTKELTEKGYLTPLKYLVPHWSTIVDYSSVKCTDDYSTKELDYKINTPKHTQLILESMNETDAKNKKTLVYCNSIEHSTRVFEKLKADGYNVGLIHSQKTDADNQNIIDRFGLPLNSVDSIDCIVSISKLTTGFNQPQAELLVLARPTKILRLYLQILFRVARKYDGKPHGIILDLSQSIAEHGFGTQEITYLKSNRLSTKEKRDLSVNKRVQAKVRLEALKEITKKSNKSISITDKKLDFTLKELRIKSVDLKGTLTKDLMNIFNNTTDIELIVSIGFELNARINKRTYESEELLSLIENHKLDFEELENYGKNKFLKDLKEDYKKKIKEKHA